ncbi:MAG: autotransporter domain-containing protein [Candidatus Megaira endosymbiont of Mesostigma viride]|nr:MAG: autotransporter domain-containing protein [Candidatus Megaira endosymbiont of Mesostigma viride]HJK88727.1 autotransporter domain-containing protein [Candidatus Megaira endosymbiont of Mesostigma viride]
MSNRKKNLLKTFACFSLLSLSTSSVALASKNTQDFTNVITFGDSFANGHNSPVSGMRVNTYAQTLAEQLGFAFTRNENNFSAGGHSSAHVSGWKYAPGGVVSIDYSPGDLNNYLNQKGKFGTNDLVIYDPLSSELVNLYMQVSRRKFIAGGVNPDILGLSFAEEVFAPNLSVFTGNAFISDTEALVNSHRVIDARDMNSKVLNGTLPLDHTNFPILFSYLDITENNAKDFVEKATLNGANYILIGNHFNEKLRQGFTVGVDEYDTEFSKRISLEIGKAQIRGALKVPGANIIVWDESNLIEELTSDPSKYLTPRDQALGNFIISAGKTSKVFDLRSHATQPVNNIKRQFVYSVITSPTLVSLLRESPLSFGMKTAERNLALAQGFANTGQVENNIAASADSPNSSDKFAIQVFGDFGKSHTGTFSKKTLGFKDDSAVDVGMGLNYKVKDNLLIGTRIGYAETKTKFVADRGKAKIREQAISLHGVYSFEKPMFVYASAGLGRLHYNIDRDIKLGLATHKEHGKTSGDHLFTTLGTGYRFDFARNISATPFVAGHYQSVTMKNYSEKGAAGQKTSTQMDFNIPKRESIMGEVGLTLATGFSVKDSVNLTPSFTVSYLHDWKDPISQQVQGRNVSEYRYFKVPAYKVRKSNMQIQGDVLAEINNKYKVGLNVSARPTGRVKSWSVGLRSAINL